MKTFYYFSEEKGELSAYTNFFCVTVGKGQREQDTLRKVQLACECRPEFYFAIRSEQSTEFVCNCCKIVGARLRGYVTIADVWRAMKNAHRHRYFSNKIADDLTTLVLERRSDYVA